jgi:hypothetical protein
MKSCTQVCREADGYQRHLVSPESGLRRLIEESMILIADPIITAVHRIHLLLVESARYRFASQMHALHLACGLYSTASGAAHVLLYSLRSHARLLRISLDWRMPSYMGGN